MDETMKHHPEMVNSFEPFTKPFESPSKSVCLSAALESLPLVYLPQTKQLVTAPWPRNSEKKHLSNSPSFAQDSCSDVPEFTLSDDCSGEKSLAGSKISEDSGYPGLWDSDVGLSREIQSERNSSVCSSDLLECDLEGDDSAIRDETCFPDPPSDGAFCTSLSCDSCFSVLDSCSTASIFTKDLQALSLSSVTVEGGENADISRATVVQANIKESRVVSQIPTVEKPKRGTFASFLTSTFFGARGKDHLESKATNTIPSIVKENLEERKPETSKQSGPFTLLTSIKKGDVEKSTTALILQERPQGLPLKNPEEEAHHRYLYQIMVEEAKQKERKDVKRQKQKMKQQLKQETATANALKIWNDEILPNWEMTKNSKKVRDLWWNGIPPRIRGRVWQMAIGNELNITAELYEICLIRAKERLKILKDTGSDSDSLSSFTESTISRESSVELIRLDVSRTFPNLCIFQKGGPYHDLLQGLLGSYACYRPDVGYVQGMSFIAAMLLLNMEVSEAFICFANLLNKPCLLAFFRLDRSLMDSYFETFGEFFQENLPCLHLHLHERNVTPDLYLLDWLFTLYTKSLSLDIVSRVWDVYFRDGEEFLFRTALGILKMYEDVLLNLDFIQLAQFLTRLPNDVLCDDLFRSIATVSLEIDKQQFAQVLQHHCDRRVT